MVVSVFLRGLHLCLCARGDVDTSDTCWLVRMTSDNQKRFAGTQSVSIVRLAHPYISDVSSSVRYTLSLSLLL